MSRAEFPHAAATIAVTAAELTSDEPTLGSDFAVADEALDVVGLEAPPDGVLAAVVHHMLVAVWAEVPADRRGRRIAEGVLAVVDLNEPGEAARARLVRAH